MGFFLNGLGSLPLDADVNFYIFVVNGRWAERNHSMIEDNFERIARSIGRHAVIAKGLDEAWSSQVASKYLGKNWQSFMNQLPALLLTDAHPEQLKDDSLRLWVPLREVERRFGDWREFFELLGQFARRENTDFLARFKAQEDAFDVVNDVLHLKPNLFGIGVNLNGLLARMKRAARPT